MRRANMRTWIVGRLDEQVIVFDVDKIVPEVRLAPDDK